MHSKNQKGFSTLETILALVLVLVIAGVGLYIFNTQKTADQSRFSGNKQAPVPGAHDGDKSTIKDEAESWERVTSAQNAFTVRIPDGWGEVLRPADTDWLLIRGQKQPVYIEGNPVKVTDLPGYGTDGPHVLTVMIHDNFAESEGVSSDFVAGTLKGKKYVLEYTQDTEPGIGQRYKGDKQYQYRFPLDGKKQLVVTYQVYADIDNKDQSSIVDQVVKSIRLQ